MFQFLSIPVIIYVPSLAFSDVTGISVYHFSPIICMLCIFYTTIGGLKAVVWTDALQGIFTASSMIAVIVLGLIHVGGIQKVFELNNAGKRLELFNTDPNPLARNTFWTTSIGGFFIYLKNLAGNPGSVQRFIAVPDIKSAKRSVLIYGFGMVSIKMMASFMGLIMYARYHNCDPVQAGIRKNSNHLTLHYVQDVASSFPGLTGIFIAGLISTSLSTMSASLNTLAGTLYEDFFSQCLTEKSKEVKANFIMKATVVAAGCICVMMVYVVEQLGTLLHVAISLEGVTSGAMLSVFIMGVLFPWINHKGAMWGMVSSVIGVGWIVANAQLSLYNNNMKFDKKPMDVSGCPQLLLHNKTNSSNRLIEVANGVYLHETITPVYALSYMYYTMTGAVIGVVVGLLVTIFSSSNLEELDPELITPGLRRCLPESKKYLKPSKSADFQKTDTVEKLESKM